MPTGTVKWFGSSGFGFITPDDSGKTSSSTTARHRRRGFKSLAGGAKVSFDAENDDKGPRPSTSAALG
jgi:CspA family cold shock protein